MDRFVTALATAQLPLALSLVAFLAFESYLRATTGEGLGMPEVVYALAAALSGALGVKRPSEHAEPASGDESTRE